MHPGVVRDVPQSLKPVFAVPGTIGAGAMTVAVTLMVGLSVALSGLFTVMPRRGIARAGALARPLSAGTRDRPPPASLVVPPLRT